MEAGGSFVRVPVVIHMRGGFYVVTVIRGGAVLKGDNIA